MNINELVSYLGSNGIGISVNGDKLAIGAKPEQLPAQVVQSLRENKQALIEWLRQAQDAGEPARRAEFTPSDFPNAAFDRARLDALQARHPDLDKAYLCSPMQQGLLFHNLLDESGQAYVIQAKFELRDGLDAEAYKNAWRQLVARYDVLRTCFTGFEDADIHQVVLRDASLPIVELDWRALDAGEQASRLAEFHAQDRRQGFDLARAPLMRLALIRLGAEAWHCVWTHHHAIMDGWCSPIVYGELRELYDANVAGRAPRLPEVVPYENYIAWLRRQDGERSAQFWKTRLGRHEGGAMLPVIGNAAAATQRHAAVEAVLDAASTASLVRLAKEAGTTMNVVVQLAWAHLLHRYSRERAVVFGSTVSGRPPELAGIERMVGLFINTLPVVVDFEAHDTVGSALARMQADNVAAFEHAYLPLYEVQRLAGAAAGSELFDSLVIFENYPFSAPAAKAAGAPIPHALDVRGFEVEEWTHYPVTLTAGLLGEQLMLRLAYLSDLRFGVEPARILEHCRAVLKQVAAGGVDVAMADIDCMDDAEKQLQATWGQATAACPIQAVHVLFEEQVRRVPDDVAAVCGDVRLSFAQLDDKATRLAAHLHALGARPGDRVGILMDRSLEMLIAVLGSMKAGCAYVALDPKLPPARARLIVEDAAIDIVLAQAAFASLLPASIGTVLRLDGAAADAAWLAAHAGAWRAPAVGPDDLVYVLYTSGSTGTPKGVMVSHASVANYLSYVGRAYCSRGVRGAVLSSPLAFDATVTTLLGSLLVGRPVAVIPEDDALDQLAQHLFHGDGAWLFKMTPAHLDALGHMAAGRSASNAHVLVIGGEQLTPRTLDLWKGTLLPNAVVVNEYGPTEATVGCSTYIVDGGIDGELASRAGVPIGRPMQNTRLYVTDGARRLQPTGALGELYIGGAGVARGYLNREALTADRFVPDPFSANPRDRVYRTGDLVRWLPDGNLEFIGRVDHQVKIRGFRIELGEIEQQLGSIAGVREVAVLATPAGSGATHLAAYVVCDGGLVDEPARAALIDGWRQALRATLPDYMVPGVYVLLDALPLTANGKVDRKRLPQPQAGDLGHGARVAPRTPMEHALCALWQDVLGLQEVGATDNFFELGGHSLLATRLVARIRQQMGIDLALRRLFEQPTVESLARHLEKAQEPPLPAIDPVRRDQALQLSFAQQRLWFIDRMNGGSTQYNVPVALELEGVLDIEALRGALGQLVERHEVLRTCFDEDGGDVRQRIEPAEAFPLHEVSLEELDDAGRRSELERLVMAQATRRFDLGHDLKLRGQLVTLEGHRRVLLLTLHHIASDGVSMGILFRELRELYAAHVERRPSALKPLRIQYADFAHWQRDWLSGAVLEEQLGYWQRQLADLPHVHGFPLDKARPARQDYVGRTHQQVVPADVQAGLKALCRQHDVTMFMLLQTAFGVLLNRYSNESDIVIGTPIAGRVHQEAHELIGFFTNTLVLRNDFAGNPSFATALARSRQMLLDAYTHQHVPFEMLVDALNPKRDMSHNALCQIMFTLHNQLPGALTLPGLQVRSAGQARTVVKFDLELTGCETAHGLLFQWDYNVDLFEAATIERVASNFEVLLRAIAENAERGIRDLPLLGAAERQLLAAWNSTPAPLAHRQCLHELFEDQAARAPDAIAVVFDDTRLSYGELNRRANQLARHLMARGARPDSRVALCLERSPEMVVGLLGILKAGAAYVPVDPDYPTERIRHMLRDSGAALVVTHSALASQLPLDEAVAICLDGEADAALLATHAVHDVPIDEAGVGPGNLAYVIYTSGSTGTPKAVAVEHRQIVFSTLARDRRYGLDKPTSPVVTSISFDVTTGVLFWNLGFGGTVHLASFPSGDLDRLMDLQAASRSNYMLMPVGLYRSMLQGQAWQVPGVELLIVGGDVLDVASCRLHAERWPGVRLVNEYGPTEATVWSTAFDCAALADRPAVPIGAPLPGVRAHVLGAGGELLPLGAVGELHVGGSGVARGYLGQPALTQERFIADPVAPGDRLYRTGDLVRWLADGQLAFVGRVDQQVKIRGYRIELGEIEHQLAAIDGVREVLVLARADERGDKQLVAYGLWSAGLTISALRSGVADRLPDYMVPAAYVRLEQWPLTPNGKIDRAALPAPEEADRKREQYAAAGSDIEAALCRVWQEVLELQSLGVHDNFFELGGSSHLSIQLQHKMAADAGYEVSITDIFAYPTVHAMAQHLSGTVAPAPRVAPSDAPVSDAAAQAPGAIAIVGMSGRFPDADSVDRFWTNLSEGVESVRTFSDEALLAAGVRPEELALPNYVRSGVLLDDLDRFDALHFGFTPREAEIMDPQQRLLFECASEALEQAGYGDGRRGRDVGVFASVGESAYLYQNLMTRPDIIGTTSYTALMCSNGRDFAATRLSYKLNLTGPSVNVSTACSSSLVAVHQACLSLRNGESRLALVGGAGVRALGPRGYVYEEGNVSSADGHCRPFDRDAQGTISGSAVGVVLLKRLADALADGDVIHAVIRGSAINNDGSDKVGYTAPSVGGQADAVREALEAARVDPDTVQYVETHGTATRLGDPIEIAGLQRAFGPASSGEATCAIGSVKANIGHCDTAAGIVGLIKTVMALKHRQLPPSINYVEANPEIPFAGGRFHVNTTLRDWPRADTPRRAGVSSFGIGGTNAHVVLEEAPARSGTLAGGPALLVVSARSATALAAASASLAEHLSGDTADALHDVAWTLQVGRRPHEHRCFVVGESAPRAVEALKVAVACEAREGATVGFVFPARCPGDSHRVQALYAEPAFRDAIDACAALLATMDLHAALGIDPGYGMGYGRGLDDGGMPACVADFAVQYALASLWQAWGVVPEQVVGTGVGELVAACVAGVLGLEAALQLALACERDDAAYRHRILETAFDTPRIPLLSPRHRTGGDHALLPTQADYWRTLDIRAQAPAGELEAAIAGDEHVQLHVGGSGLRWAFTDGGSSAVDCPADAHAMLHAAGRLWSLGIEIDWQAAAGARERRRVALPTYPFERKPFWIAPASPALQVPTPPAQERQANRDDWFYMPSWQLSPTPADDADAPHQPAGDCLVFADAGGLAERVARRLGQGHRVVRVDAGDAFAQEADRFTLDVRDPASYVRMIASLRQAGRSIGMIVHAWNVESEPTSAWALSEAALDRGFYSLLFLAQAIEGETHAAPIDLRVLVSNAHRVLGDEAVHPDKGMLGGFCNALSQELASVRCQLIDVAPRAREAALEDALARELRHPASEGVLAYRAGRRWAQVFVRSPLRRPAAPRSGLKKQGVYLVTGGLGGVGLAIAEHLARTAQTRLVLVGRSPFPERAQWPQWLAEHPQDEPVSVRIRAILGMEAHGARVMSMRGDVASVDDMARVLARIRDEVGPLDGVIHAAGAAGGGMIHLKSREMAQAVLAPKVHGTCVLHALLKDTPLDFVVLCSSLASLVGAIGQSDYCSANAFLDAFAAARDADATRYVAVNWDSWAQAGMAAAASVPAYWADRKSETLASGLRNEEGADVLERVLAGSGSQAIVSTREFVRFRHDALAASAARRLAVAGTAARDAQPPARDAEPETLEAALTGVWAELLGVEGIGVDDDFFELGGDSLVLSVMVNAVRKRLGIELPMKMVFDHTTVGSLAAAIRARAPASTAHGVVETPGDIESQVETEEGEI